ncbi:MAG: hypothetical protein ACRDSR_21880 [Pseudonocardiaceae bacterium]
MSAGADLDLLVWIVLSRVHGGGVTRQGDHYFDRGDPAPDYLAGPFADLTDAGSLAWANPDPTGRHQVTITAAGARPTRAAAQRGTRPPPLDPGRATG